MIAASGTGSGKTTVTLALLAALKKRGLSPRAFKVGPDPLDSGLHVGLLTPVPSPLIPNPGRNLDGWLHGRDNCRAIAERGMAPVRDETTMVAVIEGVMGLFDGADPETESGSSAEMAKWLNLPVLLVLNARGAGRTLAAIARGLAAFDPALRILGILCNNTGSPRHEEILRRAFAASCPDIPLLGCLPREDAIVLPSRHLGLHAAGEGAITPELEDALREWAERHIHMDALLRAVGLPEEVPAAAGPATIPPVIPLRDDNTSPALPSPLPPETRPPLRLGVSCDEALFFLAEDNLYRLREAGAELAFFSPLHDRDLPPGLDGLYLCGGYPELHAEALSRNSGMLEAVRSFAASGRPLWAAGGGFLYLLESFTTRRMAGVFPGHASLEPGLQALGYREIQLTGSTLFGPPGTRLRANEFRYSRLPSFAEHCPAAFEARDRQGRVIEPAGFTLPGNPDVLGTFLHIHLASNPGAAHAFTSRMAAKREKSQ